MKKYLLIIFIVLIFIACQKDFIRSYYISPGVMQYYFESSKFKGDEINAEIDFTFRDSAENTNDVICNFSVLFKDEYYIDLDEAAFILDNGSKIELNELQLFYAESYHKKVRYGTIMNYSNFVLLLSADEVTFQIKASQGLLFTAKPEKSFYRKTEMGRFQIIQY